MTYMTYPEKLKDPRWQKMRLQCFEMNDFTCQYCGEKEKTLHAHHLSYSKSYDPWDVDIYSLLCLCEDCHKVEHLKTLNQTEKKMVDKIQEAAMMNLGRNTLINYLVKEVNSILLHGGK